MGLDCLNQKGDVTGEGGNEYSPISGVFQEEEFLGKNIMDSENLEIDYPKTALLKMPRACKPQGMPATDPYHKPGVVPEVYAVFLTCQL